MSGVQIPVVLPGRRAPIGSFRCLLGLVSIAFAVPACARTAEERQLDEMRDEIDRIQVARDRDAVRVLHPEVAEEIPSAVASPAPAAPIPLAASPVVSLEQAPETDVADVPSDPEDPAPRPVIRMFGSVRGGGRYLFRSADPTAQISRDDDNGDPASLRPSALDPDAKRAYDAALSLVNSRQYDKALDALAAFLLKWPDHPYANNAMYWRGECYFAAADCLRASEQFEGLLLRFPAGSKVPDALFKLGVCSQKLGNPTKAREWFDRLLQQAPHSEAARHIPPLSMPAATTSGSASEVRP